MVVYPYFFMNVSPGGPHLEKPIVSVGWGGVSGFQERQVTTDVDS